MKRHVALQIPYHLARTPLAVLDAKLGRRLPAGAAPRRAVKQILGTLDSVAGRLIDGKGFAPRRADRPEPTHAVQRTATTATVAAQAPTRRDPAQTTSAGSAAKASGRTPTKRSAEPVARAAATRSAHTRATVPARTQTTSAQTAARPGVTAAAKRSAHTTRTKAPARTQATRSVHIAATTAAKPHAASCRSPTI